VLSLSQAKVEASEETRKEIDLTRQGYLPVANRAQILFFCLADMAKVDPMYQYSLEWFIDIFAFSMANSEKGGKGPATRSPSHLLCVFSDKFLPYGRVTFGHSQTDNTV